MSYMEQMMIWYRTEILLLFTQNKLCDTCTFHSFSLSVGILCYILKMLLLIN